MSKIHVIVPARMESKRFPGKMLAKMNGSTVLDHTLESIRNAGYSPHILTDSQAINEHFGNATWLHEAQAVNGTERVAHFFQSKLADEFWGSFSDPVHANPIICLVQGDEVGITEAAIEGAICQVMAGAVVGTSCCKIVSSRERDSTDVVKVVVDEATGRGVFFSRHLSVPLKCIQRHIGVYAFRLNHLLQYPGMRVVDQEKLERLEQLRWLYGGGPNMIGVSCLSDPQPHSVNSPEDIPAIDHDTVHADEHPAVFPE